MTKTNVKSVIMIIRTAMIIRTTLDTDASCISVIHFISTGTYINISSDSTRFLPSIFSMMISLSHLLRVLELP